MEDLRLPVFEKPALPVKPMPLDVWQALNAEFIRRLKTGGEYARLRASSIYQSAPIPFQLK
jgi:hypothetical protein